MAFSSTQLSVGEEDDEKEGETINGFPLRVGKAVKNEKKVKQPEASKLGIVPKVSFRWMFSGPSNSGKTNLARWILDNMYQSSPGKSIFDRIYLFSPTGKLDPVWKDLDGLRASDRITELNNGGKERLLEIFNTAIRRTKAVGKENAPLILVITDDGIADAAYMGSEEFMKSFIAGRHGNISTMVLTQSYVKIPRTCRMQMTAVSLFPSKSTEIERLQEEHGGTILGKWDFIDMVKYATRKTADDKYPFFFVDTDKPEETRFRRCLHEVLVPSGSVIEDQEAPESKDAYSQPAGHEGGVDAQPRQPTKKRKASRTLSSPRQRDALNQKRRRRER